VLPLISKSSIRTAPVPAVRNSKLLLLNVVVIKLSSIHISPVENFCASIVPDAVKFPTVSVPPTTKSFVTCKSLFGNNISPVPDVFISKSAFDCVPLIVLPDIAMPSKSASPVTVKLPVTSVVPVCVKFPVCTVLPTCVSVPFMPTVLFKVVVPLTVRSCVACKLSCTTTLPVPLARSSKSLLDVVVVIKLSSINTSPVVKLFASIVPVL
jgi:hypothetical protein